MTIPKQKMPAIKRSRSEMEDEIPQGYFRHVDGRVYRVPTPNSYHPDRNVGNLMCFFVMFVFIIAPLFLIEGSA